LFESRDRCRAILRHPAGDTSFEKEAYGAGGVEGTKALFVKRVARR